MVSYECFSPRPSALGLGGSKSRRDSSGVAPTQAARHPNQDNFDPSQLIAQITVTTALTDRADLVVSDSSGCRFVVN
jgi:hypothetical protein